MERLADNHPACRARGGDERVAIGEFVAEVCAARAERHITDGARGRAAGKQTGDEDEREEFRGVADQFGFHRR